MSWRNMKREDIKRGTIIRLGSIENDGGYCMATIISEHSAHDGSASYFVVARPYAYAANGYNSKQPLMGCEVFDISVSSVLSPTSDVQVFQGRDSIRSMLT